MDSETRRRLKRARARHVRARERVEAAQAELAAIRVELQAATEDALVVRAELGEEIRQARAEGASFAEIGQVLDGISRQRVQQLLNGSS